MDNHWLASLGAEDQSRLTPHLHPRDFEQGEVMHEAGEPSEAIWFPTAGAISLLTIVSDQRAVETAVIGAEGLVGATCGPLNGWRPGSPRDNARKLHPDLKGWSALDEPGRDKDRDGVIDAFRVARPRKRS